MANLAAIKAEVLRIVEAHITELTDATTTHVQRAQRSIEDRLAFKIQDATITYTTSTVHTFFAWPSDFICVKEQPVYKMTLDATQYTFMDEWSVLQELGIIRPENTGPPTHWSEEVNSDVIGFQTWPVTDENGPSIVRAGGYDILVPYYRRLDTLANDADTNWWSENMDDVLAWKAAANVFSELRDPMAQFWNGVAAARFLEILRTKNRAKLAVKGTSIYPSQRLSSNSNRRYGRDIVAKVP